MSSLKFCVADELPKAMESCPRENVENLKKLLQEENLYLVTEAGEQGRLPVLIIYKKGSDNQKRPAVAFLHSTHKCKEWLRPLLEVGICHIKSLKWPPEFSVVSFFFTSFNVEKCGFTIFLMLSRAYASRGYITIAVDSRYHGERAKNKTTYRDALISAWKKGDTMPFIFDTVWDLINWLII